MGSWNGAVSSENVYGLQCGEAGHVAVEPSLRHVVHVAGLRRGVAVSRVSRVPCEGSRARRARLGVAAGMCAGSRRTLWRTTPNVVRAPERSLDGAERRLNFSRLRNPIDTGFSASASGRHARPSLRAPWHEPDAKIAP
eukprot:7382728-Prymnesium_polylepis.1